MLYHQNQSTCIRITGRGELEVWATYHSWPNRMAPVPPIGGEGEVHYARQRDDPLFYAKSG